MVIPIPFLFRDIIKGYRRSEPVWTNDIVGLNQFGPMRYVEDYSAFWAKNFIILKRQRKLFHCR